MNQSNKFLEQFARLFSLLAEFLQFSVLTPSLYFWPRLLFLASTHAHFSYRQEAFSSIRLFPYSVCRPYLCIWRATCRDLFVSCSAASYSCWYSQTWQVVRWVSTLLPSVARKNAPIKDLFEPLHSFAYLYRVFTFMKTKTRTFMRMKMKTKTRTKSRTCQRRWWFSSPFTVKWFSILECCTSHVAP